MAEDSRAQERTEQATPQRRRDVREKGQVAKSSELNSVLMLAAGLLLLGAFMPRLVGYTSEVLVVCVRLISDGGNVEFRLGAMMWDVVIRFFAILAPVLVGTVVVSIAANLAQVGFHFTPAAIEPKLDKLNPIEGFKRIFGKRALVELAKGIFKVFVVGVIAWVTFKSRLADMVDLMFFLPADALPEAVRMGVSFVSRAILALAVLAVLDYGYQRWEFEKSIRMTRQDIKEEIKEHEGDPILRSRLRSIQHKLASQRMMEGVKSATLVITNPTQYAVALRYKDEDPAPRVVAKGVDRIARRIREIAHEHGVPIVEKPTLARILYKQCDIGQLIPTVLYEAVAEVMAYVYSLGNRLRR